MEILLKVDGLNLPELNEEDARNALFALAKHEYHNASTIEDAYISDGTIDAAEMNFGFKEPDAIIGRVHDWNPDIQRSYELALNKFRREYLETGKFPLDNLVTYELHKATMAIYDIFYDYAECAHNLDGILKVVLTEQHLSDIQSHPENYATINIYPQVKFHRRRNNHTVHYAEQNQRFSR